MTQFPSTTPRTPLPRRAKRRFTLPVVTGALALMLGILGGASGYTFYYARGGSYLSNDPKACVNCHIMREQYDGWQKASHHAVATCNDCHTPHDFLGKWLTKASNGWHHSRAFTLQDFHEPIQISRANAEVLNQSCLHCHADLTSHIRQIGHESDRSTSGEAQHMDCVRCHRGVGHGP